MKVFYKPNFFYLLVDLLVLILSFYVVLDWFPLTTDTPFEKYSWASLCYVLTWLSCSYLLKRYKTLKKQHYFHSSFRLVYSTLIVYAIYWLLIYLQFGEYSIKVLFSITVGVFSLNCLALFFYFAYLYAIEYNEFILTPIERRINAKARPASLLDEDSLRELSSTIREHSGPAVLKFLNTNIDLKSTTTLVFASTDSTILKYQPFYHYSTIVQLERLNNIQGINKMLSIANERLPDDGLFVCCFESKSTYKKRFLKQYVVGFNYFAYCFNYLHQRIYPKLALTNKLHSFLTGGKNRILSKAEVLGRLYCCGYSIVKENKIGQLTYLVARRVKQPELLIKRTYGPFIRLHRYGKNGVPFKVYKMRTMHPYSEFLQAYIYERNSLKEGGKFHKDIRITTIGRLMRKYWLDELPMFINLLKGEMKIVGVRPLSAQYFSLYSKELQEKRVKFKPGLLPPFYADMPRTLDEIQDSEICYLCACEVEGVFRTDLRYFFLIMQNILIKKARSG